MGRTDHQSLYSFSRRGVAFLHTNWPQPTERRSTSFEASEPNRMSHGASANDGYGMQAQKMESREAATGMASPSFPSIAAS